MKARCRVALIGTGVSVLMACASTSAPVPDGGGQAAAVKPSPEWQPSPANLPVLKPGFEWTYRWESPRGSGTFVWVVDRQETIDGVDYYVVKSGRTGEHYYRTSDLAGFVEKVSGVIELRNTPPTRQYVWPLFVGAEWVDTYTRERPADRQTEQFSVSRRVERAESATVPAGTFQTFVIVSRNKRTGTVFYECWYAPEVRWWVRDRSYLSYGIRIRDLSNFKLE